MNKQKQKKIKMLMKRLEITVTTFVDPKIPISNVPCHGCGSLLQCADTNLPGYLPSELMRNRHKSILTVLIFHPYDLIFVK